MGRNFIGVFRVTKIQDTVQFVRQTVHFVMILIPAYISGTLAAFKRIERAIVIGDTLGAVQRQMFITLDRTRDIVQVSRIRPLRCSAANY